MNCFLSPQSNNIVGLCVVPALRDGQIVRIVRRDGSLGHEVYVMQGEGMVQGVDNDEVYAVVSEDDLILSNEAALVSMARSIRNPAV